MVSVEVDEGTFEFDAGQHVKLGLRSSDSSLSGPYSIASPPLGGRSFDVLMNLVAHQKSSSYEAFKPGVEIAIDGPKGRFLFRPPSGRRAVFIAGGTGVAPLRSMILDVTRKGIDQPILLVLAARRADHLYFVSDWERLESSVKNFRYLPILSEPDGNWSGLWGLPTDHLADITECEPADYYVCGPPEMVKILRSRLEASGVDPARLFTEG
ncbi:MAG: FAD-dependent oxidoreductase [Nitrospirae bacterium]|nr:FAD-dependent oxidoreductase [Nitrospirota bacterium]